MQAIVGLHRGGGLLRHVSGHGKAASAAATMSPSSFAVGISGAPDKAPLARAASTRIFFDSTKGSISLMFSQVTLTWRPSVASNGSSPPLKATYLNFAPVAPDEMEREAPGSRSPPNTHRYRAGSRLPLRRLIERVELIRRATRRLRDPSRTSRRGENVGSSAPAELSRSAARRWRPLDYMWIALALMWGRHDATSAGAVGIDEGLRETFCFVSISVTAREVGAPPGDDCATNPSS
jgi:hypothetical protein